MKRLAALLIYVVAWLGLAALLAPLLYAALNAVVPAPFSRYVNRSLMLSALALLWPLLRYVKFSSKQDWGVAWPESGLACWRMPFLAGLASVLGLLALAVGGGWIALAPGNWIRAVGGALLAAALVPVLEGLLFRGVFQSIVVRAVGPVSGIVGVSLLFAVVHFLKVPRSFAPDPATWTDGFQAILLAFSPLGELDTEWPRFLTVLSVGLVLGFVAWRDGHIWRSVAVHAAWVLGLQTARHFTVPGKTLWGTQSRLDGSLLTVVMIVIFAGYWFAVLDRRSQEKG